MASISILDSGITFDSRPERSVGHSLARGYNYLGRLQYLPDNISLCPDDRDPSRKFQIIKPADAVPVALIASSGKCSLKEKALVATTMIEPPNLVQYLILNDPTKRLQVLDETEDEFDDFDDSFVISGLDESVEGLAPHNAELLLLEDDGRTPRKRLDTDDESYAPPLDFMARTLSAADDQPPVAVLHVSYKVGQMLLNVINTESYQVKISGGTKILLNGVGPSGSPTVVMWMLTVLFLCSCGLCCILMAVRTGMEDEQQQSPTPPVRRRLTLQEVRTRFPAFHFNPEERLASNDATQYCQLLDECTICLDEFHVGVRCRQLPCQHVFHSTCKSYAT